MSPWSIPQKQVLLMLGAFVSGMGYVWLAARCSEFIARSMAGGNVYALISFGVVGLCGAYLARLWYRKHNGLENPYFPRLIPRRRAPEQVQPWTSESDVGDPANPPEE